MDYGVEAINRHRASRGKVSIASKMKVETMEELSIAYTPGVAAVSLAIAADKSEAYALTNRGNNVAVVTDGSAVLGLGNIGPEAAMAVMEGKCILFKGLADIDAFPICLATQDSQAIIDTVRYIAPTFGGINLEDISSPRCFEIEAALQDLGIPVFHDDQHGTAIVILATIINALQVVGKKIEEVKIVFSGAGAGSIASARLLVKYGATNVLLVDSQGLVHQGRTDLNPIKAEMLKITNPDNVTGSLADAMQLADVFVGLSAGGIVTQDMVRSMAPGAAVFAAANPTPEIMPDLAQEAGAVVIGTGRSDFPNQINNSLAFPGVFRGALDVRATRITNRMKIAGAEALAGLVAKPTAERIIPWSLDKDVVPAVSHAVARAWQSEQGQ
ncbi:MAG: NADP-dependent malic enzyme [Chloroflexi bacterium]|nr:NADP-dependent malic enzyme [Chloroflexota bacterium]